MQPTVSYADDPAAMAEYLAWSHRQRHPERSVLVAHYPEGSEVTIEGFFIWRIEPSCPERREVKRRLLKGAAI